MYQLSEKDESFLEDMGITGVLITSACLLQHIFFMSDHWLAFLVIGIYVLSLISYILLMKKKLVAPLLLLVSTILIFVVEVYMILALTYSVVLLILLLFSIVTVVLIYTSEIVKKLKQKTISEKQEEENWKNIL